MIMGSHVIVFSSDPEADRTFSLTSWDTRMSTLAVAG
jgi:hypothetical protein